MLTAEVRLALAREAARAPSVHNIQPARWRFVGDADIELLRDVTRTLPVGDPTGHDAEASLGAAWEGMAIACSRHGLALGEPVRTSSSASVPHDHERVARAPIHDGATADPLAPFVDARHSHRGRFAPVTPDARAALRTLGAPDAIVLEERDALDMIATLHDAATWHAESGAAYHAELWSWLRLSPSHPDWSRDGLNADCLALSRVERTAARLFLWPPVFGLLSRRGVARALVSETAQVRSSAGVVLFAPRRTLSPFDVGRRFYRLWLEIAATGLYAAPMSATSDWADTREEVERRFGIGADRRLANVLRVGAATDVALSPRLDALLREA